MFLSTSKNRSARRSVWLAAALCALSLPAMAQSPAVPEVSHATLAAKPALPLVSQSRHSPVTPEMLREAGQKMSLYLAQAQAQNGQASTQASAQTSITTGMVLPNGTPGTLSPLTRAALDLGTGVFTSAPLVAAAAATTGAPVPTSCPDYYSKTSQAVMTVLPQAFGSISKRDIAGLQVQMPAMDAVFNAIPLKEVAPEICNDHVNVYPAYQYFKLSVLKDAGAATGIPANLPIVKQPELPYAALAYAVGWSKYEFKDFDGAFLAFAKGLIIDPYDADIASEYVATLMQMKRYTDVVGFTENFLTKTYNLKDQERSKFFSAHGLSLLALGYPDAAEKSLMIALFYNPADQDLVDLIIQLRNLKAKSGKS